LTRKSNVQYMHIFTWYTFQHCIWVTSHVGYHVLFPFMLAFVTFWPVVLAFITFPSTIMPQDGVTYVYRAETNIRIIANE
jgi:hypothetical protein